MIRLIYSVKLAQASVDGLSSISDIITWTNVEVNTSIFCGQ